MTRIHRLWRRAAGNTVVRRPAPSLNRSANTADASQFSRFEALQQTGCAAGKIRQTDSESTLAADGEDHLRAYPFALRLIQGDGVQWFLRIAQRVAPEFEFFVLPKQSLFPVLIRLRNKGSTSAFDGTWSPIQIRARRRSADDQEREAHSASDDEDPTTTTAKDASLRQMISTVSYRRRPGVPCIMMSSPSNSCFVFPASASTRTGKERQWETMRLCTKDEIHFGTAAGRLRDWLREEYASTARIACSGDLQSLIVDLATTPIALEYRMFLVQLLQLPGFNDIRFYVRGTTDSNAHNAVFHGRRLLIRRPERLQGTLSGGRRLRFAFSHLWHRPLLRRSCGIDYFALMVDSSGEDQRLGGIGIIPVKAIAASGNALVRKKPLDGDTCLKQQPVLQLSSENLVEGGDFKGFGEFFFFFDSLEGVLQEKALQDKFTSFIDNIFSTWDHTAVPLASDEPTDKLF
ncbi:unnamed protein product [Amoebophrya sp. A25]|nr:unnamed protein product [Amoebophrya sp. A25]|eukprot:GSA25T00021417001.1